MNSNSYCTSKLLCKATIKWTVWLVHFAERTEGKLATFTVVNLVATAPQTWPCYFLSIVVFTTSHRHSENKKEVTLGNRLVALLQLCKSLHQPTKILDPSEIHPPVWWPFGSRWSVLVQPAAQQTTSDKALQCLIGLVWTDYLEDILTPDLLW